ncbi:MAG: hypothetical protein B7Y01_03910, partial [Xanthobacter sp. 17-67-6]
MALLAIGLLIGSATLALAGGFFLFTARIAGREPVALKPVDAIVVLTGGQSRVSDGVQLLAEGHGKRLLITGV